MTCLKKLITTTLCLYAGLFVFTAPTARSEDVTAPASIAADFKVEGKLRRNFDFWVRIYSEYDTQQALIHDSKYIDLVYEVLDFRANSQKRQHVMREAKRKWRELLISVHRKQAKPETFTQEERRVFALFSGVDEPNKFLAAAHRKRLRVQLGQKDRFLEGYIASGKYLPFMEDIFKLQGLPTELTRLPFVESSFNLKARSKVGASGIWQFMRSTGRLYLKINVAVDERNDPYRATEAAANLLKDNYESLGAWPVAVTAYNHGRKGMMRAVRQVGTSNLESITQSYRSRSFGFASSNFFVCLAAAIEVERNAAKYFGEVKRDQPVKFYEVPMDHPVSLRELKKYLKLDSAAVAELNPGLSSQAQAGSRDLPQGYRLRLPMLAEANPESEARIFLAGYQEIPTVKRRMRKLGLQPLGVSAPVAPTVSAPAVSAVPVVPAQAVPGAPTNAESGAQIQPNCAKVGSCF